MVLILYKLSDSPCHAQINCPFLSTISEEKRFGKGGVSWIGEWFSNYSSCLF